VAAAARHVVDAGAAGGVPAVASFLDDATATAVLAYGQLVDAHVGLGRKQEAMSAAWSWAAIISAMVGE
jgi:predicted nicotinamide N-methyase